MKKSNVIVTAIIIVFSAFLLWLWYFLGLNAVDQPLDLIVSVVWWVLVAVGVALIIKFEKDRRRSIRTVYVADGRMYNSEIGVSALTPGARMADEIATRLAALEYGFDCEEAPEAYASDGIPAWRYVVRTEEFRPADRSGSADGSEMWKGEVVTVATGESRRFSSRDELAALLA